MGTISHILQLSLHIVTQAILVPVIICLILLIIYALVIIGSTIVEYFTERRHFIANEARDINAIYDAPYDELPEVIGRTTLLGPQKAALEVVANNMGLPDDDLFALAKAEVQHVDARYQRIVKRGNLVAKLATMFGLMGTLIPLGPGIAAMGEGDVAVLSSSLTVAFDTTVAGVLAAVVVMIVVNMRSRWYGEYLNALEALMTSIIDKAAQAREEGVELGHDFTHEQVLEWRTDGKARRGAKARPSVRDDAKQRPSAPIRDDSEPTDSYRPFEGTTGELPIIGEEVDAR